MNDTEQVGIWCIWLVLSDDSSSIGLNGNTSSVEGSQNGREGRVVVLLA